MLKLVVFEVENAIWITTPELEADCIQEMKKCGVKEHNRKEVSSENSLLIEATTKLNVCD